MKIQITAQLDVGVRWDEQARVFVSYAPALQLYSQGPSEEEAFRAIESAIRMYIVTAHEANKLSDTLNRLGFSLKRGGGFTAPSGIGPEAPGPNQYIQVLRDGGFDHIDSRSIPLEMT